MIYVSSSCIQEKSIEHSIRALVDEGYQNIELSGGTDYQEDALEVLLKLKEELNVNYLLHNYFPTPVSPFVLNLASLDENTSRLSIENIKKSIDWSVKLGAEVFAFHAGFLLNIPLIQIGKKIGKTDLFDEVLAYEKFSKNLYLVQEYNNNRVNLYVENNVLSLPNYESFCSKDPFFFTSSNNLIDMKLPKNFGLLLDVAHLKVSCQTLGLNFNLELNKLYDKTSYIHISDNCGSVDSNDQLEEGSLLYESLSEMWVAGKTITIEVYSGLKNLKKTHETIEKLNKGK